jgi:hypothetical protein
MNSNHPASSMFLTGWSSPYASATYKAEYRCRCWAPPSHGVWRDLGQPGRRSARRRINIKSPGISIQATRPASSAPSGRVIDYTGLDDQLVPAGQGTVCFPCLLMPDYAAADALTQGEVGKDIFKTWRNQVWCPGLARTATAKSVTQAGSKRQQT